MHTEASVHIDHIRQFSKASSNKFNVIVCVFSRNDAGDRQLVLYCILSEPTCSTQDTAHDTSL